MTLKELLDKHEIDQTYCWSDLPPGWESLVDNLFTDMINAGWDKNLHQLKSKFGGLRVYISSATDAVHELINEAEDRSLETCEECGATATQVGKHWIATLCEEHAKELEEKNK